MFVDLQPGQISFDELLEELWLWAAFAYLNSADPELALWMVALHRLGPAPWETHGEAGLGR